MQVLLVRNQDGGERVVGCTNAMIEHKNCRRNYCDVCKDQCSQMFLPEGMIQPRFETKNI